MFGKPSLNSLIHIPNHVTALYCSPNDQLCLGSSDGSVRIYNPQDNKVVKAIRGLKDEVSSITWNNVDKNESMGHIYVGIGTQILAFDTAIDKMVLTASDAFNTHDVGEDPEDVLNEIMLHPNGRFLSFSTDNGTVGVIELATKTITRMKTRHTSVCGTAKFIPDRPSELVSGGYDSALLHFDFNQGSLLSRHDLSALPQSSGIALSPPFVLSSSISSTALLAVGTADGRLWLGAGGEKASNTGTKKKRARKWEGLKKEISIDTKIAEGPIVAVEFIDPIRLVTCTLLGNISLHLIGRDEESSITTKILWTAQVKEVAKVNAMCVHAGYIAIGGFDQDGKGLVEKWELGIESPCLE